MYEPKTPSLGVNIIFQKGEFTVTLFIPHRGFPKLHVQENNQSDNLKFIKNLIITLYEEVIEVMNAPTLEVNKERCELCGKTFSKKYIKKHMVLKHEYEITPSKPKFHDTKHKKNNICTYTAYTNAPRS